MHAPSPKTLLVIDDAEGFRERIVDECEVLGWQAYATNDLGKAETWLAQHTPEVVLLDFELPGQNRQDYADLLERNGLLNRTLLITATLDERRRLFIAEYGMAGVRVKPLDMERLEDALTLPTQANTGRNIGDKELAAVIDALPLAANMLDNELLPIWGNAKADLEPITQEQGLIIRWLYADMDDKGESAARRLDWDGEKQAFLETRLYSLGQGEYWLARDWRRQGDHPHDHELLNLEDSSGRVDWLKAVARLLAQRYAISRLRVYKIAPLPDCLHPSAPPARLVIPLFQSGGGFATSYEAWWHTGFLAENSPNTLEALADDYIPSPMFRRDREYPCHSISFGTKGSYRVQFPVDRKSVV
jgi:CheY-like chemotaxis protein